MRVRHLWWFGRLIANTDMHAGNLSFSLGEAPGTFNPAPTYDMLPMLYAPLPGGEVPPRGFEPALPSPPQRAVWLVACGAAIEFWMRAARDRRIGGDFQRICLINARQLEGVAARV